MPVPQSLNITQLQRGDQLKIVMKAGRHVEPDFTGHMTSPARARRALGYSRTTFFAFLLDNHPTTGRMRVNVQGLVGGQGPNLFTADIEYTNIRSLQQVVPYGRPVVETAPKSHPGAQALGTRMAQLFPQPYLIPVFFVGS